MTFKNYCDFCGVEVKNQDHENPYTHRVHSLLSTYITPNEGHNYSYEVCEDCYEIWKQQVPYFLTIVKNTIINKRNGLRNDI